MKIRSLIIITLLLSTTVIMSQTFDTIRQKTYEMKINHHRHQKDESFKNPQQSPLTEQQIASFEALSYFSPDTLYKVTAVVTLSEDTTTFVIPTTTDRKPLYRKYGVAKFVLNQQELELTIYQNKRLETVSGYEDYLFIPFNDLTNGVETYGGGRYLDLRVPKDNKLILDFNKAYNPYCAYNHKYSCPIPPDENNLKIEIRAGERNSMIE